MRTLCLALCCLLAAGCDDEDHDGFGAAEDCDDQNPDAYPGAEEVCDGVDNDCDGLTDPPGSDGTQAFYKDEDQDGWGDESYVVKTCAQPAGFSAKPGDCDDKDPTVKNKGC